MSDRVPEEDHGDRAPDPLAGLDDVDPRALPPGHRPASRWRTRLIYTTLAACGLAAAGMLAVCVLASLAMAWAFAVWLTGSGPLAGSGIPAWVLFCAALMNAIVVPVLLAFKRRTGFDQ